MTSPYPPSTQLGSCRNRNHTSTRQPPVDAYPWGTKGPLDYLEATQSRRFPAPFTFPCPPSHPLTKLACSKHLVLLTINTLHYDSYPNSLRAVPERVQHCLPRTFLDANPPPNCFGRIRILAFLETRPIYTLFLVLFFLLQSIPASSLRDLLKTQTQTFLLRPLESPDVWFTIVIHELRPMPISHRALCAISYP